MTAISIALAQVLPWLIAAPILAVMLTLLHLWCRADDHDREDADR